MLQLSPEAAQVLNEVRGAEGIPETYGVRVYATPEPEGEIAVHIAFTEVPEAGDEILEQQGTHLYVAEEIADPLSDAYIDAVGSDAGPVLVVKRPEQG